jgi:hypothetical protein
MLIRPLYKLENFKKLYQEISDVIETVGKDKSQIICQGLEADTNDWDTGIGRIEELEVTEEKKYNHVHPFFRDSVLESIIKKHNAYRTRIMTMNPRKCYSVHADPTPRLHIPIVTNNQCWMIWPNHSKCSQLIPGFVYWTDTSRKHTFINGGVEDRVHVVMCIDPGSITFEQVQ